MIFAACMIRFEPTIWATGTIAQMWAVGIPALSSSLVSVAPQRVLVPHVEVRMTPDTPPSLRSSAMASPIFLMVSTILATPVVL